MCSNLLNLEFQSVQISLDSPAVRLLESSVRYSGFDRICLSQMNQVFLLVDVTLWLFNINIAMENGPFIDGLPINNGDFPWRTVSHSQMLVEISMEIVWQ